MQNRPAPWLPRPETPEREIPFPKVIEGEGHVLLQFETSSDAHEYAKWMKSDNGGWPAFGKWFDSRKH